MARLKRLLCDLILITQCVLAEDFNPEKSHVFAEPGSTATIPCNFTRHSQYQWYKEDEAGRIEAAYTGSCDKNTSDRLFMTCSPNVTLMIKNVNREDAGTYYCTTSNMNPIFHSARTLVITGPRDPRLSILVQMDPSGTAMMLCVASGWSHSWTHVKWSFPEAELTAQSNVDIDGTFRSLIIIPGRNKTDDMNITCSIKKRSTGETIQVSQEPVGDRDPPLEDCWIVIYVGIPVIVLILLVHQIILCRRRQTVSKGHTRPARKPRATNEAETVVYSAVKSRDNLSPQS